MQPDEASRARRALRITPALALETIGLAGAGLIGLGAFEIYHPAGVIVWGVEMVALAIVLNRALPAPPQGDPE